jgi:putative isomerase
LNQSSKLIICIDIDIFLYHFRFFIISVQPIQSSTICLRKIFLYLLHILTFKKAKMKLISYATIIGVFLGLAACRLNQDKAETSPSLHVEPSGWNTWNNPNLLSFVKMPEGLSLRVTWRNKRGGPYWVDQSYIINPTMTIREKVTPIIHTYDGSYIEMLFEWGDKLSANIKAANDGEDIVILVTPEKIEEGTIILVLEAGILWNKPPATISHHSDMLTAKLQDKTINIRTTGEPYDMRFPMPSAHLVLHAEKPTAFYTGSDRTMDEIHSILEKQQEKYIASLEKYRELKDAYEAMQAVVAWNIFYDAENDRALTSVSRIWNEAWGGYIIFDWDTYFAALMLAIDHKGLAYSNAIAITNGITDGGFIPNVEATFGVKSYDRSQPPVGSMVCKLIYDKYQEPEFLNAVYENLLTWNRWWDKNRNNRGFLSWGSNPHPRGMDNPNTKPAAMLESGLDNSPKFDKARFNPETHMLELTSVGLMGLYVADCNYLADIAEILGKEADAAELRQRSAQYGDKLQELWDDSTGIFRDKHLDSGEWSDQLAPTHFYPLIAGVATQHQAERMIKEFFMNPNEFYGEYMIPSISRSSKAFPDNHYWRGRIWAPMNFLVYMGLRNYDLPEARKILVDKSENLILKEWTENRHVYENYNADTGVGGDVNSSDAFYSWGGLLAFIALMEHGYFFD